MKKFTLVPCQTIAVASCWLSRAPAALLIQLHSDAMRMYQCLAGTRDSDALHRHLLSDRVLALAAVLILVMACGDVATPDQVVKKVFDAFDGKDGDTIVACMSMEALEDIHDNLEEMKENPEESAAIFADFGVEISPEEIESITAGELISAFLSSEELSARIPDFSNVVIGETLIDGDDAMVFVTIDGDQKELELVLENGNWKIDDGMNFM